MLFLVSVSFRSVAVFFRSASIDKSNTSFKTVVTVCFSFAAVLSVVVSVVLSFAVFYSVCLNKFSFATELLIAIFNINITLL